MTFRQRTKLASPARLAPVLTLVAAGCSLIVPLDYVGGGGASSSGGSSPAGTSGQAGLGGNAAVGGTGALGGSETTGGSAGTGGSEGGTDNGGASGGAGMAGEDNGGDGPTSGQGGALGGRSGGAGAGAAGTAGLEGGSGGAPLGGRGGMGGLGGLAGGGAGAGGCGNPDFTTDHEHCGSCENACDSDEQCLEGYCASSPCDGICATFSSVTLAPGVGYKRDNIGTGEVCAEVSGYDPSPEPQTFVCWNFENPKYLELNGVTIQCTGMGEEFDVPLRLGGYCVHATPGEYQYRGFEFPN